MSVKQAAEELLKIADDIEKDAAEVTEFVCDSCNHTAVLATINQKRLGAATDQEENITVAEVTVNDKIKCPACDGIMSYHSTEASEAYYFNPEKKAGDDDDDDDDDDTSKKDTSKEASEPIDYDSLERYQS